MHAQEFSDWKNSHHDRAMAIANDSTVRANFNNTEFENRGIRSKFYRQDEKFMVNTEGPDGSYQDYQIIYTFGYEPLQQYIIAFPNGKFQCLRTAWDTEKGKWFDLYPDLDVDVREWIHWTKGGLNWNTMCSDCHSTNVKKNYNNKTDSFDTEYSIINVSCEACHGPSKKHVDYMQSGADASNYKADEQLYLTNSLSSKEQVNECARCHVRRTQFVDGYKHKGAFMDYYAPQIISDEFYYPDGQILDEDYVFASFTQSKMYHNGVKCSNCHNPHSLELKAKGNILCTQCHTSNQYDTKNHHFHEGDNASTQCINCHMTGQTYMGNDFRRDHSFRIPRPDQSIKYKTPNACTQCHIDKSDEWAASTIEKWYGKTRPAHFSDALTLGSTRLPESKQGLEKLLKNEEEPAIARATALHYLSQLPNLQNLDLFSYALSNKEPIVRYTAIRSIMDLPTNLKKPLISPLLSDSIKSIRISAASALAELTQNDFENADREAFTKAKQEYLIYLNVNADFPGGQMNLGQYYQKTNKLKDAEKAYSKALELDYFFNAARMNLAYLYNMEGRNEDALNLFKQVIEQEPAYAPVYYSTGLLLAEMQRLDEASEYLEKAANLDSNDARVYYNWGLTLQKQNKITEAEEVFLKGLKVNPEFLDIDYALTIMYMQQNQYKKAKKYAEKLISIQPENAHFQQIIKMINDNLYTDS